jgi:hypothetical protein
MALVEQYKYIILEDKKGKILVINEQQERTCLFDGKVVERGIMFLPEGQKNNNLYWLGVIFNKRKEYISKRKDLV